MFLNERRKLKRLCKEIAFNKNIDVDSNADKYNDKYNMMIISIFAVCILGRIQGKQVGAVKGSDDFYDMYNKEISYMINRFPFLSKRITSELKIITNNTFSKISNYINEVEHSLDNVLAWAYQYLKYDKEKNIYAKSLNAGNKIEGDGIAPATQFFTEDYMVQYLVNNTLKQIDLSEVKLSELKILDPACGGGNFLVYTFEKLYYYFAPRVTSKVTLINDLVENVLTGYDIDPDLAEVATLNIYLKAASFINPDQLEICPAIYTSQKQNEEIGSLFKCTSGDIKVLNISNGKTVSYNKIFKEGMYQAVLTNPPFMGIRNMSKNLLNYTKDHYPTSKGDLCIAFILRCTELVTDKGIVGIVNQTGWMFLSSYLEVRRKVLVENNLIEIVDLGSNSFFDINGEKTNVALTILSKESTNADVKFLKFNSLSLDLKEQYLLNDNVPGEIIYNRSQTEFLNNKGYVLQYESSRDYFKALPSYREYATPMQGTSTGDNKQFVDYSWNRQDDPDWKLVSKGGGFSKWSGLNIYKVKWGEEAEYIKQHPSSALRNLTHMDATDLVYSDTGTRGLSVRILKEDQKFIASGPGIRIHVGNKFAHLSFLNTRTVSYFLRLLTPKYTIAAGYIGRLPVTESIILSTELAELGEKGYYLKEAYLSRKLTNEEFVQPNFSKIHSFNDNFYKDIKMDLYEELQRLEFESDIELYVQNELKMTTEDVQKVTEKVGKPVFQNKKKEINVTPRDLDTLITKILNKSCQYVSNKKTIYGMEGILEDLSFNLDVNPKVLFEYIINNLDSMQKVKQIYSDDLLHKAVLSLFDFQQNTFKYRELHLEDITLELSKLLPFIERKYIEDWIQKNLWPIHLNVFKNNPVLEMIGSSSIIIRTKRSLVTS